MAGRGCRRAGWRACAPRCRSRRPGLPGSPAARAWTDRFARAPEPQRARAHNRRPGASCASLYTAAGAQQLNAALLAASFLHIIDPPMKFALGQSISRLEDDVLLRGAGRYADDFALARAAHACFVRSPHAHAKIKRIS